MKYKLLLAIIVPALIICGCSRIETFVNDLGSSLEILKSNKVSTFSLSNEKLKASFERTALKIYLKSMTNSEEYVYDAVASSSEERIILAMTMPKDEVLADSDYSLSISDSLGNFYPIRFTVSVKNEMVAQVISEECNYDSYFTGSGTKNDEYIINNPADFEKFLFCLSHDSNNAKGLFFRQGADISIRHGVENGYKGQPFAGNYNGGGMTISNLEYEGSGSESDSKLGLFSELRDGASISNLKIENCYFSDAYENVGAVAGSCIGDVSIDNVNVTGNVDLTSISSYGGVRFCGGYVGHAHQGVLKVSNSTFSITIDGGSYLGGVLGGGDTSTLIISNVSSPEFKHIYGDNFVGGVCGSIDGNFEINEVTLTHPSTNTETKVIQGKGNSIGGLIGKAYITDTSSVQNIELDLPVKGDINSSSFVGGLIGEADLKGKYLHIYSTLVDNNGNNAIEGKNNVGGFFGMLSNGGVVFDGYRKSIQNAHVNGVEKVGGLVGYLNKCTAEFNYSVLISSIIDAEKCVGGFAGKAESCGTILVKKISFSDVTAVYGSESAGGFIGHSYDTNFEGDNVLTFNGRTVYDAGSISKPIFSGFVNKDKGKGTYIGGFIGQAVMCDIKNIVSGGSVYGSDYIGGMVGLAHNVDFSGCVSKNGEVSGSGKYVGGIAGEASLYHKKYYASLLNLSSKIIGTEYTGGIFGYFNNTSSVPDINNCVNNGSVQGYGHTGGIVGGINKNNATFHECANFGNVSSTGSGLGLGGILGFAEQKVEIYGCANHGKVEVTGDNISLRGVGGIAGLLGEDVDGLINDDNYIQVVRCCNRGDVLGSAVSGDIHVGGIVGFMEESSPGNEGDNRVHIHLCYNSGNVDAHTNNPAGIIGCFSQYNHIHECINYGDIQDGTGHGCIGQKCDHEYIEYWDNLYSHENASRDDDFSSPFNDSHKGDEGHFKNFNFDTDWSMVPSINDGFPYLQECFFQFAKIQ